MVNAVVVLVEAEVDRGLLKADLHLGHCQISKSIRIFLFIHRMEAHYVKRLLSVHRQHEQFAMGRHRVVVFADRLTREAISLEETDVACQ